MVGPQGVVEELGGGQQEQEKKAAEPDVAEQPAGGEIDAGGQPDGEDRLVLVLRGDSVPEVPLGRWTEPSTSAPPVPLFWTPVLPSTAVPSVAPAVVPSPLDGVSPVLRGLAPTSDVGGIAPV